MKCKNCGTANTPGALKCRECNVPLTGSMLITGDKLNKVAQGVIVCKNCQTQNPASALKCSKCNAPFDGSLALRATEKVNINATSQLNPSGQNWTIRDCPSCGYPNKSISDDCVSCGESLYPTLNLKRKPEGPQGGHVADVPTPAEVQSPSPAPPVMQAPQVNKASNEVANMNRTVNPWVEAEPESKKFMLELLDTDYSSLEKKLEFEGDEISLNRQNLESENSTITQKTQAMISKQQGNWVLTDKSDMQTTFVKPGAGHTLRDGDILLMGNRLFKFSEVK